MINSKENSSSLVSLILLESKHVLILKLNGETIRKSISEFELSEVFRLAEIRKDWRWVHERAKRAVAFVRIKTCGAILRGFLFGRFPSAEYSSSETILCCKP